jgi:hypothetical protein
MKGVTPERSKGAHYPNTRSLASKQGPKWQIPAMMIYRDLLRWPEVASCNVVTHQWGRTLHRNQENSNLVMTYNTCLEMNVNFTQPDFLALKNWINTSEWNSESSKGFLRHTMLLLPNVSHYHLEYFCLQFIAVWVCFPWKLSLPKEPPLICNLEK